MDHRRIKKLNNREVRQGEYILYWMQHSQRTKSNHALNFAIQNANRYSKPLLVFFGLTDRFPEANLRHYSFMLDGILEVKTELHKMGIGFCVIMGTPDEAALTLGEKACAIVVDRGYLRIERQWRNRVAEESECAMYQIESDLVVPIEEASDKEEYSAATIRRKLRPKLKEFSDLEEMIQVKVPFDNRLLTGFKGIVEDVENVVEILSIDKSVSLVKCKKGGYSNARRRLDDFIENKLDYYDTLKNHPDKDFSSGLSAYLHFGQISPIEIYNKVKNINKTGKEGFIEEIIVRRELAFNYIYYNNKYDSYSSIPSWAAQSLEDHKKDVRKWNYSLEQLELSGTHDPYWNAAQTQLYLTGDMHGYMRMYWGKKIIEWTDDPENAFNTALYLNNKYSLDGRDPNSFAGIAWCFGKHDRPWVERPIFGKIRFMNANGLQRKFDIESYVKKITDLKF